MFAKVFSQIFDSSIAENHTTRHVFMDMLVLANSRGEVDMTTSAIARRTNVPLSVVESAIKELEAPDDQSRTREHEGRRLLPLQEGRGWGWRIVNYELYRSMQTAEARREYFREYRRAERAKPVQRVHIGSPVLTKAEGEGEGEAKAEAGSAPPKPPPAPAAPPLVAKQKRAKAPLVVEAKIPEVLDTPKFREAWSAHAAYRHRMRFPALLPESIEAKLKQLAEYGPDVAVIALTETIANGWKGVFPERIQPLKTNGHQKPRLRTEAERDHERTGLPAQEIPTRLL